MSNEVRIPCVCALGVLLLMAGAAVPMAMAATPAAAKDAVQSGEKAAVPAVMPPGSLREPIVSPRAADQVPSPPVTGSSGDEEMPQAGKGQLFSEFQIRYCLAQQLRIDAVRPLLNRYDHPQIRRFNDQVGDFNARCGSYRYYGSALQDAKAWLEAARPRIQQEAREAHMRAVAATASRGGTPGSNGTKQPAAPAQKSARGVPGKQAAAGTPPVQAQKEVPAMQAPAAQHEVQAGNQQRSPELPAPPRLPTPREVPAPPAVQAQEQAPAPDGATSKQEPPVAVGVDTAQTRPESAAPALPPAPRELPAPPAAAAPAAQPPTVPTAEGSATPAPDRAAKTASIASAARPADNGQEAALARLTEEVRSVGSMVLERPKDGAAGDATAQLEVRYAAGGYIKSIVIARSSGSAGLDERALAIARTLRLPSAPQELQGQDFAVLFPVVFRSAR
jgi:TonB family protein